MSKDTEEQGLTRSKKNGILPREKIESRFMDSDRILIWWDNTTAIYYFSFIDRSMMIAHINCGEDHLSGQSVRSAYNVLKGMLHEQHNYNICNQCKIPFDPKVIKKAMLLQNLGPRD